MYDCVWKLDSSFLIRQAPWWGIKRLTIYAWNFSLYVSTQYACESFVRCQAYFLTWQHIQINRDLLINISHRLSVQYSLVSKSSDVYVKFESMRIWCCRLHKEGDRCNRWGETRHACSSEKWQILCKFCEHVMHIHSHYFAGLCLEPFEFRLQTTSMKVALTASRQACLYHSADFLDTMFNFQLLWADNSAYDWTELSTTRWTVFIVNMGNVAFMNGLLRHCLLIMTGQYCNCWLSLAEMTILHKGQAAFVQPVHSLQSPKQLG